MAAPTFHADAQDQSTHLIVVGDLNAQFAMKYKVFLSENLVPVGNVTLDLKEVTAFDPSAIQLTHAWKKKLSSQGRQVIVAWPVDNNLADLLQKIRITEII